MSLQKSLSWRAWAELLALSLVWGGVFLAISLALRELTVAGGVDCIFSEPQFDAGPVTTLADGTDAAVLEIDPYGRGLEIGASYYPDLLKSIGADLQTCQ